MACPPTRHAALRRGHLGVVVALVAVGAFVACGGGEPRAKPAVEQPGAAGARAPAAGLAAPTDAAVMPPIDAGPRISEAVARQVIAARFRAAGFRVRHDVRVERGGIDVTLDGYDPRLDVGFEYVASSEVDADLSTDERALLAAPGSGLLIVDAAPLASVLSQVDSFLAIAKRRLTPDGGVAADAIVHPAAAVDAARAQTAE